MLSFLVIVPSMSNIFGHHSRPLQQAQKTMNMFLVKLSKFVLFVATFSWNIWSQAWGGWNKWLLVKLLLKLCFIFMQHLNPNVTTQGWNKLGKYCNFCYLQCYSLYSLGTLEGRGSSTVFQFFNAIFLFSVQEYDQIYLKQRKLQQLTDDFKSKFSAPQQLMKLVFVLRPWTNLFLKSLVKYSFFNLVFLLGQSGILCCCFQDASSSSSWLVLKKLFFNFPLRNSWSVNGSCRRRSCRRGGGGGGGGAVEKCTH